MSSTKVRIKYVDALKLIGILAIISLHVFQIWDDFVPISEITRFGVPVFLMVTGALLLNRDIPIDSFSNVSAFFKKKIVRLVYPFVFYLIIYALINPEPFNILGYNWYFWMIICVYLSIPIINKFVLNSSIEEIEYWVWLIVISSIILQILNVYRIKNFIDLTFFLSPITYLILGYYFSKKEFKYSKTSIINICILLFIISTAFKMMGRVDILPLDAVMNRDAIITKIFTTYLDVGVFQIIQASSIFLIIKNIYESKEGIYNKIRNILEKKSVNNFILSVSKASYGMYLVNRTFMLFCDYHIKILELSLKKEILFFIIITFSVFILSWALVVILSKIPVIKKFSGYA